MQFSLRLIANGCILRQAGKEYAFTSREALGEFLMDELETPTPPAPVPNGLYIVSVPPDKKISCIRIIRELSGLGLREAKDVADGVDKSPVVTSTNIESLRSLGMRIQNETGAVVGINPLTQGHPSA